MKYQKAPIILLISLLVAILGIIPAFAQEAKAAEPSMELRQNNIADVQAWVSGLDLGEYTLYFAENVNLGNAGFTIKPGVSLSVSSSPGSVAIGTRSSGPSTALFSVTSGGTLKVGNVTLDGGGSGGGASSLIDNAGTLVIQNGATLRNNTKASAVQSSGVLSMTGGAITGNVSTSYGGGIYVRSGTSFVISGGIISGNMALNGGGVAVTGCALEMSGGTISGNTSTQYGGGIFSGKELQLTGGTIGGLGTGAGNTAKSGGGIYATGELIFEDGEVSGNKAVGTDFWIPTTDGGGGMFLKSCTTTITGGTITKNTAENGGGLFFANESNNKTPAILSGGTISENSAPNGGGVYVGYYSNLTLKDTILITRNTAPAGYGGGLYSDAATINMLGGEISGNKVTGAGQGGGVFYSNGDSNPVFIFHMSGGVIKGNEALGGFSNNGGGIHVNGGTVWVSGGTITENAARNGNGICVDTNRSANLQISGTPLIGVNDTDNGVYLPRGKFMSIVEPLAGAFRVNISGLAETAPVDRVVARKGQSAGVISDAEAAHFYYQKEGYGVMPLKGSTTDYVVNATPVFTSYPDNVTVSIEETASFSVGLKSRGGITLQWERSTDGGESWERISGETDTTLSFAAQRTDDGILYRCVATNQYTSVASDPALLAVRWVDILEQPINQSVVEGGKARFSVTVDVNPEPASFQWEKSVDGGATWVLIENQTESFLDIENASANDSGLLFRCLVGNGSESVYSDPALLEVHVPKPDEPIEPDKPSDPNAPKGGTRTSAQNPPPTGDTYGFTFALSFLLIGSAAIAVRAGLAQSRKSRFFRR